MPRFEVLIPQSAKTSTAIRLQLEAENWLDALKQGYKKTVEGIQSRPNVLCDIKEDNSIHVTDTDTGRAFCILELPAPETTQTPSTTPPLLQPSSQSIINRLPPAITQIGRPVGVISESAADLLEEIFQTSQELHNQPTREKALYFALDLAINKIGTDVGSIFLQISGSDKLFPSAARGPKVNEVMKHRITVGFGPASFSVAEGMGLALSDIALSPIFYKKISENIGYLIRSSLWAPVHSDGVTVGALELINKKKTNMFSEGDLNAAGFIADQLGAYLVQHRN